MSALPVLLDTDPGVDDAMALLFLHRHPRVQLLGITTVFGNAEVGVTTRNALYLAERFGIAVPVARGAALPLVRPPRGAAPEVHGDDGLGNLPGPIATSRRADARPAHRLIIDTLRARPGEVTLVAVGPLTNLALALAEDPEVARLVRQVVVMGGAFGVNGHGGNVSPVAEANAMCDPHAADAVFTAPWPVTIVGLDVTHEVLVDHAAFERLREGGGDDGAFLWACSRHYVEFYRRAVGVAGCFMHDASAAALVVAPHLFGTRTGPVRVVGEGIAVGQTIQASGGRRYSQGQAWEGLPAQQVCTSVRSAEALALFVDTICRRAR
jgi:inosine-uridine nucleoside N-ribohydrolase